MNQEQCYVCLEPAGCVFITYTPKFTLCWRCSNAFWQRIKFVEAKDRPPSEMQEELNKIAIEFLQNYQPN